MIKIHNEDEGNDTNGRQRMYMSLKLRSENGIAVIRIPSESTVCKVISSVELIHKTRRNLNGITKADRK